MRILLVAPQPFYTERGTPIAVRAVVETLSRLGHRVDVLTYHLGEDVRAPEVHIFRARRPRMVRRIPIGPSWQKAACDLRLNSAMGRLLRWGRYDLVHAVEEAAFLAAMHCPRRGVPFVYDMDSLMSEQLRDKGALFSAGAPAFARLERWVLRRAAGVLAVCPCLVDEARRLAPPSTPVALLPDFPLPGIAGATPDAAMASLPGVRCVYVGNLEPYQGVDLLLDAFAKMAPCAATLVVVGGSAEAVARLQRAHQRVIASGQVHLLGARSPAQLGSMLAAADVLVSPRIRGRNTPMKIYSYMAAGRAILATDLPTHRQVLDDDVALLARPDAGSMAAAMARLIDDAPLRARLGEGARARAEALYSRARFDERLEAFYEQLAARGLSKGREMAVETPLAGTPAAA